MQVPAGALWLRKRPLSWTALLVVATLLGGAPSARAATDEEFVGPFPS
jgi:hypothetical protein